MEIELNNIKYKVIIERKNNKNMYLRIKEDGIHIYANYFITNNQIVEFITNNQESIEKMYNKLKKKVAKKEEFYYLGNKYDVIIINTISKIEFYENKVFVKNKKYLDTFLINESKRIFNERLKYCYSLFEENIPFPIMKIWKMKRKWGYCNKKEKLIKLNFDLIKYSIDEIDYVIIHELCHFIEFNHSKEFWKMVSKYKPNYKKNQLVLKEE